MNKRIIKYDEILDNCGMRLSYDENKFNLLLLEYKNRWKEIILPRHCTFIEKYIETRYSLKNIAREMKYSEKEIAAIFLRIQSQFELYDEDKNVIFRDGVKCIYDMYTLSNAMNGLDEEYSEKSIEVEEEFIKVEEKPCEIVVIKDQTLEEVINNIEERYLEKKYTKKQKLNIIVEEFAGMNNIEEARSIIGDTFYNSLILLISGGEFESVCSKNDKSSQYLLAGLVGIKNPRYKSEEGLVAICKKYLLDK